MDMAATIAVPACPDAEDPLREILRHPGIWRRSASAQHHVRARPTGLPELDAALPGGGWPCGALSEILFEFDGVGELTLLMPALAELTRQRQRVVFVAPPYIPYAPALAAQGLDLRYVVQIDSSTAEGAWSAEQCLRSGSCGAVLSWLDQGTSGESRRLNGAEYLARGSSDSSLDPAKTSPDMRRTRRAPASPGRTETTYTQLRRLQLAAESGDALAFLFRPAHAAGKSSPAALRLQLHAEDSRVDIEILKCRSGLDRQQTRLRLRA
jgi:hypothetical protein